MRFLIDGYNLMHAAGVMPQRPAGDRLRKMRQRFLNDLAETLDPVDAHQTTVVFDATDPPPHLETRARHKGMTILFAVDEDDADERIENLIQTHPDPKRLTVVSSDIRVKTAASRRRCKVSTCDDFLNHLDRLRAQRARKVEEPPAPPERPARVSAAESAEWLEAFKEIEEIEEFRDVLSPKTMITDDEIARLEREIARETGSEKWNRSQGRRPPEKKQ